MFRRSSLAVAPRIVHRVCLGNESKPPPVERQLGIVEGLKGGDRRHIVIVRPDTASSPLPVVAVSVPLD